MEIHPNGTHSEMLFTDWLAHLKNWDGFLESAHRRASKNSLSNQFRDLPEMILIDNNWMLILQVILDLWKKLQESKKEVMQYKNHRHRFLFVC